MPEACSTPGLFSSTGQRILRPASVTLNWDSITWIQEPRLINRPFLSHFTKQKPCYATRGAGKIYSVSAKPMRNGEQERPRGRPHLWCAGTPFSCGPTSPCCTGQGSVTFWATALKSYDAARSASWAEMDVSRLSGLSLLSAFTAGPGGEGVGEVKQVGSRGGQLFLERAK